MDLILIAILISAVTSWVLALKEYGGPVFSMVGNCLKPVLGRIYDAGLGKLPNGI